MLICVDVLVHSSWQCWNPDEATCFESGPPLWSSFFVETLIPLFFCYQLWCLIAGGACSVCDYLSAAEGHDGYHLWSHTKVSFFFLKKKKVSIWTIIQVAYNIIMVSREMAVPYDPLESGFIVPAPLQVICSTLLLLRRPFFFSSPYWCLLLVGGVHVEAGTAHLSQGAHLKFWFCSGFQLRMHLSLTPKWAFTRTCLSLTALQVVASGFANLFCSSRATG